MRRVGALGLVVAAALLAAGCGGTAAGGSAKGQHTAELQQLVSELGSHGATVGVGAPVTEPFFSASGRVLHVNGKEVQVLRFATSSAARVAAAAVSPDGYSVGASEGTTVSHVDWVATPHLYRRGSLIVVYVGDDAPTLQLLGEVVGPQFAGGR